SGWPGTSLGPRSRRSDSLGVRTVRCSSNSRKRGRTGAARWYSRPRTCWCAFALRCRGRAFIWCATLVFSPAIPHSSRVVPEAPEDTTAHRPSPAVGDQLELLGEEDDRAFKAL